MSGADELPHAVRAQEEEKERNELEGQRLFTKEPVNAVQDLLRLGAGVKFHAEAPMLP